MAKYSPACCSYCFLDLGGYVTSCAHMQQFRIACSTLLCTLVAAVTIQKIAHCCTKTGKWVTVYMIPYPT